MPQELDNPGITESTMMATMTRVKFSLDHGNIPEEVASKDKARDPEYTCLKPL